METHNPFDDENATCRVLINAERQYSLWPELIAVPAGWSVVFGPSSRAHCDSWLEANWLDMRPASLRQHDAISSEQEPTGV